MRTYPNNSIMKKIFKFKLLLLLVSIFIFSTSKAQKDTSEPQKITIISAYKPVLRTAAKLNFSGSNLVADTVKNLQSYDIPVQHLVYGYQPISLKPLSVENDTLIRTGNRYAVKAGYGSQSMPYVRAAASFGDGETSIINVYGDYYSAKGKIANQDFSHLQLKANGSYFFTNNELYAAAGFKSNQYYQYGYDHNLHNYSKDFISNHFQDIALSAGFRNTTENAAGINYDPHFSFDVFNANKGLYETTLKANLPANKKINDLFTVKAELNFDLTHFQTKGFIPNNITFYNNVNSFTSSIFYKNDLVKVNGGAKAVFNNGKFLLLPDVYGEMAFMKEKFLLQAGWTGKVIKNTYQHLTDINPYLGDLFDQTNTIETELFGGIKSSLGKHILFSAKASFIKYKDFQLFYNDTSALSDGRRFLVSNERSMGNFRLHGDLSYIIRDKFKLTGGIDFNGYAGMKTNAKAWNTLPVEANASVSWYPINKLTVKSDFYFFAGGYYLEKGNIAKRFDGAADWSLGFEYKIKKQFGAFINLNNIFGKNYERWHGYPVYGFNVLGGLSLQF